MTSKALAQETGYSERWVRKVTEKARAQGLAFITLQGTRFFFALERDGHGVAYRYTKEQKSERVHAMSASDAKRIGHIDPRQGKLGVADKLLLVTLYRESNASLDAITTALFGAQWEMPTPKERAATKKRIKRWVEAFEKGGKKALEDKRGNTGGFRKVDEALLRTCIIMCKARSNREGYMKVHYMYGYQLAMRQGVSVAEASGLVDYATIVRATRKVLETDALLGGYEKGGWDMINQSYPVGVRDIAYANQEWQVDATKIDFMVRRSNGTIGRLNYTIAIDSYSGCFVGRLCDTLNSYDQVRVLFEAIKQMGKPELIRLDNGMDYKSEHYQNMLVLNECGVSFAKVGHGRQKGKVERVFGYFQDELALLPGYIGNDVQKRTKIENQAASKIDRRTSKATRIDPMSLLSEDELREVLRKKAAQHSAFYAEHEGMRLGEEELREIYATLGKKKTHVLQESGVQFNKLIYQSAALWTAGLCKGDMVEVRENIDDVNRVFVYKNGEFVCEAVNRELGTECMTIEDHRKSVKAYKTNHVNPLSKEIRRAHALMREFEGMAKAEALGIDWKAPEVKQKPKERVVKANEQSTHSLLELVSKFG